MATFSVKTRVRADGTLHVAIPTGLPETDVDVLVVIRPIPGSDEKRADSGTWPERFFDETFGSLADDPLVREPQPPLEAREKLL